MEVVLASGTIASVVTVVTPEGKVTETNFKEMDHLTAARGKTIAQINELSKTGWEVVQLKEYYGTPGFLRETYLLEKH